MLYNSLSWLMVVAGCILVAAVMLKTRAGIGLPMTRAPIEGLRMQLIGWVVFTALSIPILFWSAMFAVGGMFGVAMVLLGRFTPSEAKAMALYGQPPARWVAEA